MESRTVALVICLVAFFTLASAVSFGFYLSPYKHGTNAPTYEITHESTDAYAETVEHMDLDTEAAIDVDALPSDAQRVFADAIHQSLDGDSSDWKTANADVCRDEMVVCDGLDAPPEFPEHASSSWDTYTLVEQGGEQYVVVTRGPPNAPIIPSVFLTLIVVVVFSALLVLVALKYRKSPTIGVYAVTTLGVVVGLWPYLVMAAGIESYWWLIVPLTGFGIVVLLRQIAYLTRHADDERRRRVSA